MKNRNRYADCSPIGGRIAFSEPSLGQRLWRVRLLRAALFVLPFAILSSSVEAASLTMFNSGTGTDGFLLPLGSVDPHITIIDRTDGLSGTAAYLVHDGDPWVPNDTNSIWLSASPDRSQAINAQWTYRVPIDLSGFEPGTAAIQARVSSDNQILWTRLNGTDIGFTTPLEGFGSWHSLLLTNGLASGVNYLDFRLYDWGLVSGFRIELSGTALALEVTQLQIFPAVELVFGTASNRLYQLQYCERIDTNTWYSLGEALWGDGTSQSRFDGTRYSQQRFYRLETGLCGYQLSLPSGYG